MSINIVFNYDDILVGISMLGPTMPILAKKLGVAEGEMGLLFTTSMLF